ncbi:hemolysin [Microtetraspora sp. NBRC 13810]|uniref:right-handed parallel beta-helix repeat-containing protein n=1 Tax=Microtetraspora sp. NBRC 13810 TaxID=3030990 RepID=UPI0024A1336B|nr:right-handed parallel beta-helix repeat-containing protein [Microtetraspora sp. NBRC 13810]GLW06618.1 hemolysin [Microtetraspora sp. NBRC 13810]
MSDALVRWTLPVAAAPLLVTMTTPGAAGALAAGALGGSSGTVYYVDAEDGDDDAPGTGPGKAWRSLKPVNDAGLGPGDTVRFERGGRWTGVLTLTGDGTADRPIAVTAYGEGPEPVVTGADGACVRVEGSHWRISALRASGCDWAGFEITGDRNELVGVKADRNVAGVVITNAGSHNVVRDSELTANNRMSVNDGAHDNDSGAFGVLLNGDDNLVTANRISGSFARSVDYGYDGAAVEIFNGDRNRITHNVAHDNETFTELGAEKGRTASGNVFAHNVVTSSRKHGAFLVTRGPGHVVGPVKGTVAVHNSVHLPGRDTLGWSCHDGCSPDILRLRYNVISVGGVAGDEDAKGADEAGGVYRGRSLKFKLGPRSVQADPRFRGDRDLRLRPGSPALRRAARLAPLWYGGAALVRDVTGRPLPALPDAGAYQH